MKAYEIIGRGSMSETVNRRSLRQKVTIDRCLDILSETKYPDRNKAMFYLREIMRLKDIAGLRTIGDVLERDGQFRPYVVASDGQICSLDARARGLLTIYLMKRFRKPLELIGRHEPLFPTEKSDGAQMSSLPQLFWAIDLVIRNSLAKEKEGNPGGDDALFPK
jgi:hypothetical protein